MFTPPPPPVIDGWSFEELLTPREVANLMRVDPKTVNRWATAGRLVSTRTLGGHRRYSGQQVRALMQGHSGEIGPLLAPTTPTDSPDKEGTP